MVVYMKFGYILVQYIVERHFCRCIQRWFLKHHNLATAHFLMRYIHIKDIPRYWYLRLIKFSEAKDLCVGWVIVVKQ